jgi:hypothetical protein
MCAGALCIKSCEFLQIKMHWKEALFFSWVGLSTGIFNGRLAMSFCDWLKAPTQCRKCQKTIDPQYGGG